MAPARPSRTAGWPRSAVMARASVQVHLGWHTRASRQLSQPGSWLGADRPPIEPGDGDDGQFFYRLALAPADLGPEAHGRPLPAGLLLSAGWPTAAFHALVV